MRLVSARIRGAGRLVDTTIKLDQKVIAIVGPNEAGKTTLLHALAYADKPAESMPLERRSRFVNIPDTTPIVSLRYLLAKADQAAIADLNLAESPTEVRVSRPAGGGSPKVVILPTPRKAEGDLHRVVADLGVLIGAPPLIRKTIDGEDESAAADATAGVADDLRHLHAELSSFVALPVGERGAIGRLREIADDLLGRLGEYEDTDSIELPIRLFIEWIERPDPHQFVLDRLWQRTPDLVMFDEDDRSLASAYVLDEGLLQGIPAALENLARLAALDLNELHQAIVSNQISRRDTIKNKANANLATFFAKAWQQSNLTVEFNVEANVLRIGLVEDGIFASIFDERSAGLRMFVALTAFLATRNSARPKVLLIDEAENHLHIDAQADLVNMFAQQDKADKVIYTTHSPACLPADLGVGIRALVVDGEETSHVENSFWQQNGGAFSSLMFAMGASAAAFTPARCAVIAEGATDMLLLPSLIRAACDIEKLPYQIAPGLSEMPTDLYPALDFEAAKVAFLVDGDGGGDQLAKHLGREVPKGRIVKLVLPGVENVIEPNAYRAAFTAVLGEVNAGAAIAELPELPDMATTPWAKYFEDWAKERGLRVPTKVEVANKLMDSDGFAPSSAAIKYLRSTHRSLCKALGIAS